MLILFCEQQHDFIHLGLNVVLMLNQRFLLTDVIPTLKGLTWVNGCWGASATSVATVLEIKTEKVVDDDEILKDQ